MSRKDVKHPITRTVYGAAIFTLPELQRVYLTREQASRLHIEQLDLGNDKLPNSVTKWLRQGRTIMELDGVTVNVRWPAKVAV